MAAIDPAAIAKLFAKMRKDSVKESIKESFDGFVNNVRNPFNSVNISSILDHLNNWTCYARYLDAVERATTNEEISSNVSEELVYAADKLKAKVGTSGSRVTVSIDTEEIVLEKVNFGPFRVTFVWGSNSVEAGYEVQALKPNRPDPGDTCTHPHVSGTHICTGRGGSALAKALSDGRICDAFEIIHSILCTYNPSSPYRRIEAWLGEPCHDCGDHKPPDQMHHFINGGSGGRVCTDCGVQLLPDKLSIKLPNNREFNTARMPRWALKSHMRKCPTCKSPVHETLLLSCALCGAVYCPSCKVTFHRHIGVGGVVCSRCTETIAKAMVAPVETKAEKKAKVVDPNAMGTCDCGAQVRNAMIQKCSKSDNLICPICDPEDTGLHESAR